MKLKSFSTSAAFMFTALIVMVVAAATSAAAQTYTDLYNFTIGQGPESTPIQGRDGNLYGTTFSGGNNCPWGGCGVFFRITPGGKPTALYEFEWSSSSPEGTNPSGLTLGTDGNYYGTTYQGPPGGSGRCTGGCGTIFKITPSGNLTTLYTFGGISDGGKPTAPPVQGTDGDFYGTTNGGNNYGFPLVAYKVTSSGTFTPLGALPGPSGALVQGVDGDFYGTTSSGGSHGNGTVFKMTPEGVVTVVRNFGSEHGSAPSSPLIQGSDGNFYGTTDGGGSYGYGVVFKLTPQGTYTVLHNFAGPPQDGYLPAGLVQATDGNFYGVTLTGGVGCSGPVFQGCGVIFQITPAGDYSVLYDFDNTDGSFPTSAPVQHTNGGLYGVASWGGAPYYDGVFYGLDMGLGPFVSFVRGSGKVGQTAEVLGQGFTGTTAVSFNGTPATFTVEHDAYLTATVPDGATTGTVTVTTPGDILTSNNPFRVTPVISSFSPTSGPVGTVVTITGESLTQTAEVGFCGPRATSFTVNSDMQVIATVPAGAPTTGHIEVITSGGVAVSPGEFTVTP